MLAVQTCQLFSNIRTDVTNDDDDNVVDDDDGDDNDVDDDVDNEVVDEPSPSTSCQNVSHRQ